MSDRLGSDHVTKTVLDGLPEGVVVLDRAWVYRYVNPAAANFLHTSTDALLGRTYYELYPEAVGSAFELAYVRVMDSGVAEAVDEYYEPWDQYFRNRIMAFGDGIVIFFSDVTAEGRNVAADRQSRARLQQVLDFAPIGIVLQDLEGRYRLVNTFAADRTGRAAADMLGKTAASFVPAALAAEWKAKEQQVLKSGQMMQTRVEITGADGRRHYRSVIFPTYDDAGQLDGTGSMYNDVTEQAKAEHLIAATERRYRELFEQASLGQVFVAADDRIIDANRSLAALLGYSREELLTLTLTDLSPAAARRRASDDLAPGPGEDVEDELRHRDGSLVPVLLTATIVDDPVGHGSLYTCIVRDQSVVRALEGERERALDEMLEAQAGLIQFRALVEASDDFIGMASMEGRIIYVNPAGRELVGFPPEADLTQTTVPDYLTEEGMVTWIEVERPALLAAGRWSGDSTVRDRRGGPPIPVATSNFFVHHPETGEPLALATVRRDITQRLAAEAELRLIAAQRSELLHRLVASQEDERARIAADVHDDSVQALAAVDLRLGVLHRHLHDVAPQSLELIGQVQESVRHATERLRGLLFDLEPPDAGVALADALRDAAAHLFDQTPVSWSVTDDAATTLSYAQRVQAIRIAKQALSNVRAHADASHVDVSVAARGGGVEITIDDNGVGAHPQRDTSPPGHRGLTSMRDRAASAGGWWRLEPGPHQGTRVQYWLPSDLDENLSRS